MKNRHCDWRDQAKAEISGFKSRKTAMIVCGAALAVVGLLFLLFIRSSPMRFISASYFGRVPSAVIFWIFSIAVYFLLGMCIAVAAEERHACSDSMKCILDMCVVFCLLLIWYPLLYAYHVPLLATAALVCAGVFCVFALICSSRIWITLTAALSAVFIWILYLAFMCVCFMITV